VLVKKMSSEEKERKRPWATVWTLGLLLVVAIASMGLVRRSIDLSFGNGSFVRVTPASLWSSCGSGSSSKIFYHPNGVKSGTVALWQDFADRPIIVMLATNGEALLCLYNFDVDLRLLKIDPTQNPKPFQPNSRLDAIVCSSPWHVESGTTNDWQEMSDYLRGLSSDAFKRQTVPAYDLGVMRFGLGQEARENLLRRVEEQITVMHQSGAAEWPVPGR
jgi:hypothetical protein